MLHGTFYTFILSWPVNVDFQSHMTMHNMHNIHNIHNMQNMHNMHIMHGMQKCILCIICIIFCIQITRIVVLRTLISCNNIFSYKFKSFLRGVKWRVFVEPQHSYNENLQSTFLKMLKCNFAMFSIWQASTWQTGVCS